MQATVKLSVSVGTLAVVSELKTETTGVDSWSPRITFERKGARGGSCKRIILLSGVRHMTAIFTMMGWQCMNLLV